MDHKVVVAVVDIEQAYQMMRLAVQEHHQNLHSLLVLLLILLSSVAAAVVVALSIMVV